MASKVKVQRTEGPFWQPCNGGCGDKAEANRTPKGLPVLCAFCAKEAGQTYLPPASKAERAKVVKASRAAIVAAGKSKAA